MRIDPSTGQEVLTGTETLVRLDNGSYVLSDLDDATLRSELTNNGLESRMPQYATTLLSNDSGDLVGFSIKAVISVQADGVYAVGSSNSAEIIIEPVANTPSFTLGLEDNSGASLSTSTGFLEDETNFFDFDFSSSDADGSETFYVEIDEPANGTILGGQASNGIIRFDASEADNISFTPNPHFSGNISLAFKVFSEERFGSKIS